MNEDTKNNTLVSSTSFVIERLTIPEGVWMEKQSFARFEYAMEELRRLTRDGLDNEEYRYRINMHTTNYNVIAVSIGDTITHKDGRKEVVS